MKIFSWCNPAYFKFCGALVKSIRAHENQQHIILHLMDFSDLEKEHVKSFFAKDKNISFIFTSHKDYHLPITNPFEYYRNSRPRFFLKLLEEHKEDLLTFGANGIIFTKLDFIEDYLKQNDFVFMERTKKIVQKVNTDKTHVRSINELDKHVKRFNLNLDKVLNQTTGKVVLLGTHGIQYNENTLNVMKRWINYVEDATAINKTFSDMNFFVKSFIKEQDSMNKKFKTITDWDKPRKKNRFCDTLLLEGNPIWFAKGPQKHHNRIYLNQVDYYYNWKY